MKAEDVAWAVLIAVATLSFGAMCFLGGCNVYDVPCALEREQSEASGVTVCFDEPEPCTCDGGAE